jgi:hypothetical protein
VNVLLVVVLVCLTILAWLSIVKIVPASFVSRLRYQLWQLRDDTVDDIRLGEIKDVEQARRFVAQLEAAIVVAPDFSLLNMVIFGWILRSYEPSTQRIELDKLEPRDRERLEPRVAQYQWALIRHALLGTPSGWVISLLVLPLSLARALFRSTHRPDDGPPRSVRAKTKFEVQEEVARVGGVDPTVAVLSYRVGARHVSACL